MASADRKETCEARRVQSLRVAITRALIRTLGANGPAGRAISAGCSRRVMRKRPVGRCRHVERAMAATPADGEVKHAQPCARGVWGRGMHDDAAKRQNDKATKRRSGEAAKVGHARPLGAVPYVGL